MKPGIFAEVFSANVTFDDLAEETHAELLLRAGNTVNVLRLEGQTLAAIRELVTEALLHWTAERLEPLINVSEVDWFVSPEREQLLRSLFERMIQYIDELNRAHSRIENLDK